MTTATRKPPEVWMEVIDPKRIAKLIAIQDVSKRKVAEASGWSSHTYLHRLLSGEAKTVKPDSAVRMAHFFGVGVDDLFLARSSSEAREVAKLERAYSQLRGTGRVRSNQRGAA